MRRTEARQGVRMLKFMDVFGRCAAERGKLSDQHRQQAGLPHQRCGAVFRLRRPDGGRVWRGPPSLRMGLSRPGPSWRRLSHASARRAGARRRPRRCRAVAHLQGPATAWAAASELRGGAGRGLADRREARRARLCNACGTGPQGVAQGPACAALSQAQALLIGYTPVSGKTADP